MPADPVAVWLSATTAQAAPASPPYPDTPYPGGVENPTIAIVGGTVHDGTGKVWKDAVVEFKGDRIVRVGTGAPSKGAQVVDAKGKISELSDMVTVQVE